MYVSGGETVSWLTFRVPHRLHAWPGNCVGREGARAIAAVLDQVPSLTTLEFSSMLHAAQAKMQALTMSCRVSICERARMCVRVCVFVLLDNKLANDGAVALAASLTRTRLEVLSLWG